MSRVDGPNLARIVYDAYPHSDLLPIDPEMDCQSLENLMKKVSSEDIGDSLFKFLVVEIVEGGEGTLDGAVRVVKQAGDDLQTVLDALVDCLGHKSPGDILRLVRRKDKEHPLPSKEVERLRRLDQEAQGVRHAFNVSRPGQVIWQAESDCGELLVVVADGYGGASLLRVDGNYPVDYLVKEAKRFGTEADACTAACKRIA